MGIYRDCMTRWEIYDTRTGKRAQMDEFFTRAQAERVIAGYRARDARGVRPDVSDLIPYLAPREVATPEQDKVSD